MYKLKVYYLYICIQYPETRTPLSQGFTSFYIYIYIKNLDPCIIGFLLVHLSRNIPLLRKGTGKTRLYLSTSQ